MADLQQNIKMTLKSWLSASCALLHISNPAEAWPRGKNALAPFWRALPEDSEKAGFSFLCTLWTPARSVLVPILQSTTMKWIMQTRSSWQIIFSFIIWAVLFCAPLPQMSGLICRSARMRQMMNAILISRWPQGFPGRPAKQSINSWGVLLVLLVLLPAVSAMALHYGKCTKPFWLISAKGASVCLEKIQQPLSGGQTPLSSILTNSLFTNQKKEKTFPPCEVLSATELLVLMYLFLGILCSLFCTKISLTLQKSNGFNGVILCLKSFTVLFCPVH